MIMDLKGFLDYAGYRRRLYRDIIYKTYVNDSAENIEKSLEGFGAFTCYSGYTKLFGNNVADYSSVYAYVPKTQLATVVELYPKNQHEKLKNYNNLFILEPDKWLDDEINNDELNGDSVSLPQLYIDLKSLKDWQAERFMDKILEKLGEIYGNAESIL